MKFIKILIPIVITALLGTAYGQYQVPLYAPGNSAGLSTRGAYSLLTVTGQNAIGPTENGPYKAYLGLLGPVRYVLTDAEIPEMGLSRLYQNYPNPFKKNTTIPFKINREEKVKLTVYNILGQPVEILVARRMPPGGHQVVFNAKDVSPGVFFYQLEVGNFQSTKTMVLTK